MGTDHSLTLGMTLVRDTDYHGLGSGSEVHTVVSWMNTQANPPRYNTNSTEVQGLSHSQSSPELLMLEKVFAAC